MRVLLLLASAAALSACMMSGESQTRTERNEAAAVLSADGQTYGDGARLTGSPQSCVPLSSIRNSRVLNNRVIDFGNGSRWSYRVVLPQDCPNLGFEQRFAYKTSLSQLCSTDIITVLQSPGVGRGASCGLAPFQPIELPPRR
jgi:hypothetical protein